MGQDESEAVSESFVRTKVNWFETAREDTCEGGSKRERAAAEYYVT